ncbi:MAG TPA: methyltransferase domain-containing protein [Fimbriimonas sp.]
MTDALASIPCLACGHDRFDVLMTPSEVEQERRWLEGFYRERLEQDRENLKDLADFTQSDPVFVVQCRRCGTIMRNPQPTPPVLERRYRFDRYGERTLEHLLESERGFFREKAGLIDLFPGAQVLEVGSFVGAFLLAAQERGWRARGVDIGVETCAFMRSLGLHVHEGNLADLPETDPLDAVFVWNTFDQINRPLELLRRIGQLLKPGGLLVLRFANGNFERACLDLRRAKKREPSVLKAQAYNNFLTFPYLCGYNPNSIEILLSRQGFRLKEVRGDTILPLSTEDTGEALKEEERRVKRAVARACRLSTVEAMPWLDLVATREA